MTELKVITTKCDLYQSNSPEPYHEFAVDNDLGQVIYNILIAYAEGREITIDEEDGNYSVHVDRGCV